MGKPALIPSSHCKPCKTHACTRIHRYQRHTYIFLDLIEMLGVCLCARVREGRGCSRSSCRSESVGCSRSVATAGPPLPPWSDLEPARGGLPVSPLFSSTDEHGRSQTNASRSWSVTGSGDREGERTHLMRSMIHRHPRGHTLEWGNTTHVLTGLSHNSLGLPRLRGTPKERSPGNHPCMLLNAAQEGY